MIALTAHSEILLKLSPTDLRKKFRRTVWAGAQ